MIENIDYSRIRSDGNWFKNSDQERPGSTWMSVLDKLKANLEEGRKN